MELLFQVYDHGWVPNLQTYEHMLYIAARDGDVELTRALFIKCFKQIQLLSEHLDI